MSMRNKPPLAETSESDPRTDEFDPYRFGKISFTTSFFKRLISTPLPEPNEADLVSVAPGEGPTADEARQAAARLKAQDLDPSQEKRMLWSTAELRALGVEPNRRRGGLLVVGLAGFLGLLALLVSWAGRSEGEDKGVAGEAKGSAEPSSASLQPDRLPKKEIPAPASTMEILQSKGGVNTESEEGRVEVKSAKPGKAEAVVHPLGPTVRDEGNSPAPAPEADEPTLVEETAESGSDEPPATNTVPPKVSKPRFGPKQ
jgi:hypothetical protein